MPRQILSINVLNSLGLTQDDKTGPSRCKLDPTSPLLKLLQRDNPIIIIQSANLFSSSTVWLPDSLSPQLLLCSMLTSPKLGCLTRKPHSSWQTPTQPTTPDSTANLVKAFLVSLGTMSFTNRFCTTTCELLEGRG